MKEELIKVVNVSYSVDDEQLSLSKGKTADILFDITFSVYEGEVLSICGESGGGKSTLAKLIAGIIEPARGDLVLNEKLIADKLQPKVIQIQKTLPPGKQKCLIPLG
jgi:ABC-type oligopeptide transport system ATPase subunit